jgi:hypothetical protein
MINRNVQIIVVKSEVINQKNNIFDDILLTFLYVKSLNVQINIKL